MSRPFASCFFFCFLICEVWVCEGEGGGVEFGFSEPAVRRRIPLLQNSPDAANSDRIRPAIFRNLSQFIAIFSLFFGRSILRVCWCPVPAFAVTVPGENEGCLVCRCCAKPVSHQQKPFGQSHIEGRVLELRRPWPALCGAKKNRQPPDQKFWPPEASGGPLYHQYQ